MKLNTEERKYIEKRIRRDRRKREKKQSQEKEKREKRQERENKEFKSIEDALYEQTSKIIIEIIT